MKFEAAFTESLASQAKDHLLKWYRLDRDQEELCFALWRPATGEKRTTGIVTELVLPLEGERNLHRNASFESHYLGRVARLACESNSGVAFMHSHPNPGWQEMSKTDIVAERERIAPPARAADHPLLGLTVGTDGSWSARFWTWNGHRFLRNDCEKVRVVGQALQITANPRLSDPSIRSKRIRRTLDTWGRERQIALANLKIGIVGLGSVGSIVAEALGRVGITRVLLVDADRVEEHNLDRLLYASSQDVGRFKVDLVSQGLRRGASAASIQVEAKRAWIHERDALAAVLDCDVIFAAVDRPLPKDLLNYIAYTHCIPVVFGGVRVASKPDGSLADATWSVVRAGPGFCCLRCDGQYSTSDVVMERDGTLDDPNYVAIGSAEPGNANVFPFSANLGSLMVLEMLRAILWESWWPPVPANLRFSYVTGRLSPNSRKCRPNCEVDSSTARGDSWTYPFIDDPVSRDDGQQTVIGRWLIAVPWKIAKLARTLVARRRLR